MTALLTADWYSHGKEEYFRKFEIYSMDWSNEINLDSVALTSTSFGGPIAAVRDRKKVVRVHGAGKPVISIFTSSGRLISSFLWNSGQIVQLGWSSSGELLCIQEDGAVLIYDMSCNYKHTFGLGNEVQETKVTSCQVFNTLQGTGIAVLTSFHRIFLVNSVKEPKVRRLPEVPSVSAPSSWVVISQDRHSRVLYAVGKDLYSLKEDERTAIALSAELGGDNYSIVSMGVSCSNNYLAMLSDKGKLWLGTTELKCLRLFDTRKCAVNPLNLMWCGEDAAVINWGTSIEVISRTEDSLSFAFDSSVFLVQEVDCLRIISPTTHEILQKVPKVVQDIFKINSSEPGSYLLEASKRFQKKSHRANEYLHLVKPSLRVAVEQCIEAAGHEYYSETQKMLMKAAQFGKIFLEDCSPELYVTMCRVLRCLNGVRDPKIGIPLTYQQLQVLSLQGFLELLISRQHYFLALEVATYLKISDTSRILSHWACYKVQKLDDSKQRNLRSNEEQLAQEIAEKLGRSKSVSFAEIATKAADCGRKDLAIKLVDYEPRSTRQVKLLLRLGESKTALLKAIESGNTDLVYTVLLHLKEHMALGMFLMEIRNLPLAQALYIKYCLQHNRDTLQDIYTQEDDHSAMAEKFIRESYDPKTDTSSREVLLKAAEDCFKRGKNDANAYFCDEQRRLLKSQRSLEEKFRRDVVGKSLHETVKFLLLNNEVKLADKLRSEFKMPDRRYWWLRVQVLGELGEWVELEKYSKAKRSPIGYEPFLDTCLKYEFLSEALKYLPRIREELKVKYLVKMGMIEEAAHTAFEKKDLEALLYVQSKSDEFLSEKLALKIQQLSKK